MDLLGLTRGRPGWSDITWVEAEDRNPTRQEGDKIPRKAKVAEQDSY